MRLVGVLLFLMGAAGAVVGVRGTLEQARPRDVAFALLALGAVLLALLGLGLVFVPGLLG